MCSHIILADCWGEGELVVDLLDPVGGYELLVLVEGLPACLSWWRSGSVWVTHRNYSWLSEKCLIMMIKAYYGLLGGVVGVMHLLDQKKRCRPPPATPPAWCCCCTRCTSWNMKYAHIRNMNYPSESLALSRMSRT